MTMQAWLLFCATEAILCFTPGPAVLLVVSQAISRGTRAGFAATLGILTANIAYFALSGTSLGAVLDRQGAISQKHLAAEPNEVPGPNPFDDGERLPRSDQPTRFSPARR